ncbi:MAG: AraC family transcriptional regulator [Blastocatellia bacterium]
MYEYSVPSVASDLTLEGLIMEMLGQVARDRGTAETATPQWLKLAVEMVHSEFGCNLTVTKIAETVGVHPFHLSRVFRRFYHQGIGEYLSKIRVEFACEELSKSEAQLADIAFKAGFADQSHFSRVFKRVIGVTPGAFRGSIAQRSRSGSPAD